MDIMMILYAYCKYNVRTIYREYKDNTRISYIIKILVERVPHCHWRGRVAPLPLEGEGSSVPLERDGGPLPLQRKCGPLQLEGEGPIVIRGGRGPLPLEGEDALCQ